MKGIFGGLTAMLLSGCSTEPAPATEAYLVVLAVDDASGWAAVDRLKRDLPEVDRQRIGVPSMLSEKSSTMLIPFVGSCQRDAAMLSRMASAAAGKGVSGTRCNAMIPG